MYDSFVGAPDPDCRLVEECLYYTMKLYTFGTDARALIPMLYHMQAVFAEKMAGKHLEVYITEVVDKGRLV
ncbi:hypothetical protein PG991_001730 [Apiospora marii]|uniref:Uncharacterized protein n=1 Tax=Apiospora marii TaxID=335849 RepID=A0ABR1SQI2_9PEZI